MQIEKKPYQIESASASTSSVRDQLLESLKTSKEYRHAFVEEKIRTGLAAQIKAIREHREGGMTQEEFAQVLGKVQSWVARLENPNAKPATLSTLLQVAYAFDVDLQVRFAPFSELVDWISGTPHWIAGLSAESLAVEDFEHDSGLTKTGEPAKEAGVALAGILDTLESELHERDRVEDTSVGFMHREGAGAASTIRASEDSQQFGKSMKVGPISPHLKGALDAQRDAA
jgi:transcriptional regulator with XRE-family HTH domain